MNNNRGNNGYNQNNNRYNNNDNYKFNELCEKIKQARTLKEVLTVEKVSLPETGYAYIAAEAMKEKINPNQLRKFYDMIVEARDTSKNDFSSGVKKLFFLVPQVAYSAGRKLCDKNLFNLFKEAITPDKILDYQDVKAFSDFFEAIVAYRKYMEEVKGGKR